MDSTVIYEYLLSRIQKDLANYGYSRSGKSGLFYRYSADKKVGCVIEMQKSMLNSPESYSFTFNLLCVGLYDLDDYFNDRLTISAIRTCLQNPFITEKIGILCRGRDYWWEITDDILSEHSMQAYYDCFILNDIQKSAIYLDEQARKKESVYTDTKQ